MSQVCTFDPTRICVLSECSPGKCAKVVGDMVKRMTDTEGGEKVNHPSHYGGDTPYEVIKVLEAWLSPEELSGFMRGTTITYIARAGKKEGNPEVLEYKKALWYVNRRIQQLEKKT